MLNHLINLQIVEFLNDFDKCIKKHFSSRGYNLKGLAKDKEEKIEQEYRGGYIFFLYVPCFIFTSISL